MNRRRFVILAGLAAVAPTAVVRAQTEPVGECAIGFVNGLLQYSPDCALLTPPGLGMEIAPPSHLAMPETDEAAADTAAQEAETEAVEKKQSKRDKRDDHKNRRRDRQREGLDDNRERRENRKERHRERKENGRERREIDGCEDFESFDEAQEFYDSVKYDRVSDPFDLDRDGDKIACNEEAPDPLDG